MQVSGNSHSYASGNILVDIGSGGTTQMLLEHLCSIKLYGLQLSGDERLQERLSSDRVGVYLSLSQKEALLYWAGQPILERLISEDIGSVSGYRKQETTFTVRRETQEPEKAIEIDSSNRDSQPLRREPGP